MPRTDVPRCLQRAREEVLMALRSENAEEEGSHRRLANRYFARALHVIELEPDRDHDWSALRSRG